MICDRGIRATQFYLSSKEVDIYFVNALKALAQNYFFGKCLAEMTFFKIVAIIKREYDSPTRKLLAQAKLKFLCLECFVA